MPASTVSYITSYSRGALHVPVAISRHKLQEYSEGADVDTIIGTMRTLNAPRTCLPKILCAILLSENIKDKQTDMDRQHTMHAKEPGKGRSHRNNLRKPISAQHSCLTDPSQVRTFLDSNNADKHTVMLHTRITEQPE